MDHQNSATTQKPTRTNLISLTDFHSRFIYVTVNTGAHFYEGLHPEIQAAMDTALSVLGKLTSSHNEIEIPAANDTALLIQKAEGYAYHREYVIKTPELYQAETLKRIRAGAEISIAAYIYGRRQLDQFRRSVPKVFDAVDLVVTPTTPVPPFTISELLADLEQSSDQGTANGTQHAAIHLAGAADNLRSLWFYR